jgi:uncharacterized RDD family membrane protein YckC
MNRFFAIFICALAFLNLPVGAQAPAEDSDDRSERHSSRSHNHGVDSVHIGRNATLGAEDTAHNFIVIAGDGVVKGKTTQNAVVVLGSMTFDGEADENLVVIGGDLHLGPNAHIRGNLVHIGEDFSADSSAVVHGEKVVIPLPSSIPSLHWLQAWVAHGLFLGRPFPPQVSWVWIVAGIFLAIHVIVATMFSRSAQSAVRTLERRPIAAFFSGILFLVLAVLLIVILLATLIGTVAIPFVVCAIILAWFLAGIAVFGLAGSRLFGLRVEHPGMMALAVIAGSALFYAVYMLPVIGFLVWAAVTTIGLGAVVMAAFSGMKRQAEIAPVVAVPASVVLTASVPGAAPQPVPTPTGSPAEMTASGAAAAAMPPLVSPPLTPPPRQDDVMLLARAGFWRRFAATALDFVLLIVGLKFSGPFFILFWTGYHVAMWTWKGTTIGGVVLGIKIVRLDGSPVNFGVALVRALSSFFSAMVFFLGFFWAGLSSDKQSWHDKIAGTVIVKMPKGVPLI